MDRICKQRSFDGIITSNMGNETDDRKLKEAKEKLACHIEPPKQKAESSSSQPVSSCGISGAQADEEPK